MSVVRITQIDGSLPNLALMKLAHWHRAKGDEVNFTRQIERDLFEPAYDVVYGSAIFKFSQLKLMQFQRQWPGAIVGGTGTPYAHTVEELIGNEHEHYDYTDYPEVNYSIGFTQRGCRLACKFCEVPRKEGKPRSANTIADIWRGGKHPKKLHLLDNDFFGNPDWQARIDEIREGQFRVCLSQGINIRLVNEETAEALGSLWRPIENKTIGAITKRWLFQDTKFQETRLYTAWDNLRDGEIFFRGVDLLERAGVQPKHLMSYMLIGYDQAETWGRIWERFNRMVERGIEPYPMVFDRARSDLLAFQRWVITGLYRAVPWNEYERSTKSSESTDAYLRFVAA